LFLPYTWPIVTTYAGMARLSCASRLACVCSSQTKSVK